MKTVLAIAAFVAVLAYPALVYYGLTHLAARQLVWLLLPCVILGALLRLPRDRRGQWGEALRVPAVVIVLLGMSAWLDDPRFLLALPVAINAVLLVGFAGSLRSERPLVERFARLQVPDLSPAEVEYCRSVTVAWSVFFVLNGTVAGALALASNLEYWALYTGCISYVLIGVMGASEYVLRKYRFGRYGQTPWDRALRALLPSRPTNG